MTMAKVVRLMLSLLLIGVLSQQDIAASKIAYTKPLFGFGKTSYLKEKRFRPKAATASVTTTEADWPAPIEFIISSSAKDLGTTQLPMWSSSSSTDRSTKSNEHESTDILSTTQSSNSQNINLESTASSLDNTLALPPATTATTTTTTTTTTKATAALNQPVPCTCGVFLSSQIKNGLPETPLIHNEMDRMFPCNAIGRKQCQTKCLETASCL
ncbi:Fcp3C [Drosophila busckii]|uniref:Fcp3C n=1 Tax=Drosophila busckii TaxID=30019 RepID=A0A0M4ERN5_DROBS|nr:Fcp3C [Drosophila busckii]